MLYMIAQGKIRTYNQNSFNISLNQLSFPGLFLNIIKNMLINIFTICIVVFYAFTKDFFFSLLPLLYIGVVIYPKVKKVVTLLNV
jgi:hypothetical protein